MSARLLVLLLAITLLVMPGCAASDDDTETPPAAEEPSDGGTDLRLANGLYDLEGGKVQALGILEYVDLEGSFYAITGSPEGEGNIAVIANGEDFATELEALEGKTVSVIGERSDAPSIRMAGPEIIAERIEEISDTPGIAE